jgi:hypothetical protein
VKEVHGARHSGYGKPDGRFLKNVNLSSLPRRRESREVRKSWITAFAGMPAKTAKSDFSASCRCFDVMFLVPCPVYLVP